MYQIQKKHTSSPFSPVFKLPGDEEVTQKLSFSGHLLSNLDGWIVVLGNRTSYMYIYIPLSHSEIDIQDT